MVKDNCSCLLSRNHAGKSVSLISSWFFQTFLWGVRADGRLPGFSDKSIISLQKGLNIPIHDLLIPHDHIPLAGAGHKPAKQVKLFFHQSLRIFPQFGHHQIPGYFRLKIQLFQNTAQEPGPEGPPEFIRGSPFKAKTEVIIVAHLTDKGVDSGKVISQPGTVIEIILGNQGQGAQPKVPLLGNLGGLSK